MRRQSWSRDRQSRERIFVESISVQTYLTVIVPEVTVLSQATVVVVIVLEVVTLLVGGTVVDCAQDPY